CVSPITVDFHEVFEQTLNKIERMGTVGVAGELHPLEGGREVFFGLFDFLCHAKPILRRSRPRPAWQRQNLPISLRSSNYAERLRSPHCPELLAKDALACAPPSLLRSTQQRRHSRPLSVPADS